MTHTHTERERERPWRTKGDERTKVTKSSPPPFPSNRDSTAEAAPSRPPAPGHKNPHDRRRLSAKTLHRPSLRPWLRRPCRWDLSPQSIAGVSACKSEVVARARQGECGWEKSRRPPNLAPGPLTCALRRQKTPSHNPMPHRQLVLSRVLPQASEWRVVGGRFGAAGRTYFLHAVRSCVTPPQPIPTEGHHTRGAARPGRSFARVAPHTHPQRRAIRHLGSGSSEGWGFASQALGVWRTSCCVELGAACRRRGAGRGNAVSGAS